jgi:hypothetical protein
MIEAILFLIAISTIGGIMGSLITLFILDGCLWFWFKRVCQKWRTKRNRDEEPY